MTYNLLIRKHYIVLTELPGLKPLRRVKLVSCLISQTELKIPIHIPATELTDMEDGTKPTKSDLAGVEQGPCCACQKTPEEKDREKDDRVFLKVFENFLHNAIFTIRYS